MRERKRGMNNDERHDEEKVQKGNRGKKTRKNNKDGDQEKKNVQKGKRQMGKKEGVNRPRR